MTGLAPLRSEPAAHWLPAALALAALTAVAAASSGAATDVRGRGALVLLLVVSGALVERSPIRLERRGHLPVETPIVLAAALLLDPAPAALAAAAGPLLAAALWPAYPTSTAAIHQAVRAALQALVAGLVLGGFGWEPARPVLDRAWPLLAVVPAAVAAGLPGALGAKAVAVLRTGDPPSPVPARGLLRTAIDDSFALAAQVGLAVLVAGLATSHAWMLALLLLPLAAVGRTLERQRRLRQRAEAELAHRAFHDVLTGLPNRDLFADRLAAALARPRGEGQTIAVLFLDLDRFKLVNDTLGHPAGDQFLVAVGDRLRDCVRPGDTVARLGGDEFTVLLDGVRDQAEATAIAHRIGAALADPVELGGHEAVATASIGIALPTPAHRSAAELLHDADAALYRAKEAGRNGCAVYEPGAAAAAGERLRLEADLRRAVARDELRARYRPRIELASGRVTAVEATAWWEHPERGLLEPEAFRRVAEETGLAVALDHWLLAEAGRQGAAWQAALANAPAVAVAVSGHGFRRGGLADEVDRILTTTGLAPGSLWLDVRETDGVGSERSETAIRRLHRLGVRVTTGDLNGVLARPAGRDRLPISALRLDGTVVAALEHDPEAVAVARALVGLASALGTSLLAEGVETEGQAAALAALGCDLAQGPYVGAPLPAADAGALLEHSPSATPGTGIRHSP